MFPLAPHAFVLKLGRRSNNVTTFTVATLAAYAFVFFAITSVVVMLGGKEVHAPILLTLCFATAASALVASITASTTPNTVSAELAEQRGNAAFVFSNSSGTFLTLMTALAECLHEQAPKTNTGLSLLLAAFRVHEDHRLGWYIGSLIALAVISLTFVLVGASRLNREDIRDASTYAVVRTCSVGLLVIGLAAGTNWGLVPFGQREVADLWATLGWTLVGLASVGAFSALFSYCVGVFLALITGGLVHLGRHVATLSASERFRIALRQFGVGCCIVLLAYGVGYSLLFVAEWALRYLASVPSSTYQASWDALFAALTASSIAVLIAGAIVGVVIATVIWLPRAKKAAVQRWQETRTFITKVTAGVASIALAACVLFLRLLQTLRQIKLPDIRPPADHPFIGPRRPLSLLLSRYAVATAKTAWRAFRDYGLANIPRGPIARRVVLGVFVVVIAGSFTVRIVPDFQEIDLTIAPIDVPQLTIEPVEVDWTAPPVPPPLERVSVKPVSICDLANSSVDWASGRDDVLEVPLERCRLPEEIRRSTGALVLVGLASSVGKTQRENQRALSRGAALARWATSKLLISNEVYILHLGVAQRTIPLRRYRDMFGDAVGERPVASVLVDPFPDDATLYTLDVSEELSNYMARRGVADDFSECALYRFRAEVPEKFQLQQVDSFDCRTLREMD